MLKTISLFLLFVFVVPALSHLVVWQLDTSKPESWNSADWSSSGILPNARLEDGAVIHLMAARTGRWKGGFSVHSWIVTKAHAADQYTRYDVVGWGSPVRVNAFAPDGRWYSNEPRIVATVRGDEARRLIPKVERAVADYPHSDRGGYTVWPGPNSNSFVAYILDRVPELGVAPPASAVGRNYLAGGTLFNLDPDWLNVQVSFLGYAGFALGRRHGFELHFMGLVAGIDVLNPALKIPGFGRVPLY